MRVEQKENREIEIYNTLTRFRENKKPAFSNSLKKQDYETGDVEIKSLTTWLPENTGLRTMHERKNSSPRRRSSRNAGRSFAILLC